jgi:glycosyltransferase involved in cell wall biosynthesis
MCGVDLPETSVPKQEKNLSGLSVCWIGNPRYSQPLNPTDDKKWGLLAGLGVRMFVVGFAAGMQPRRFTQHARFILLPELPVSILRYLEMFVVAPFILLWLIMRHNISVIVAGSPFEGSIGALAKNVARLFGKQVALVVESHGDFEVAVLEQRQVSFRGVYRWLMHKAASYAFRHADVLRAVSNSTREQVNHWIPNKSVIQFMTWTDVSAFRDRPREIPVSEARDIVHAGALIPRKGVHTLLEAFAQVAPEVPDAHLWIVGKPENAAYTTQLHAQTETLGLQNRVTFVGGVGQKELAKYMARGRAMVLASLSEGLPRVVVEGMMSGLVVIASRVSGIPEVIEDGVTGYLIPPEQPDVLADTLRRMYTNTDVETMTQKARTFAEQFFSENAYVDGYSRLLSAAIDTRKGRS